MLKGSLRSEVLLYLVVPLLHPHTERSRVSVLLFTNSSSGNSRTSCALWIQRFLRQGVPVSDRRGVGTTCARWREIRRSSKRESPSVLCPNVALIPGFKDSNLPERDSPEDMIFGKVKDAHSSLATDPVLLKSDNFPTYHLANIVDDHEMGITHVIRGEVCPAI